MLVTYVTVADEKFFLGAVALVNSLRIAGNPEPIVVIDAGLSPAQRAFLSEACEVRSLPVDRSGALPAFLKPAVFTLGLEGTTVVLDSDMIVTSRLEPILAEAAAGKLCVFTDIEKDRYFEDEWVTALGLENPIRPRPYINSGFVAFQASRWQDVITPVVGAVRPRERGTLAAPARARRRRRARTSVRVRRPGRAERDPDERGGRGARPPARCRARGAHRLGA